MLSSTTKENNRKSDLTTVNDDTSNNIHTQSQSSTVKINSDNELFNQIFKFQGDQCTKVSGLRNINLKGFR